MQFVFIQVKSFTCEWSRKKTDVWKLVRKQGFRVRQRRFNARWKYVGFFDHFNEIFFVGYLMLDYSLKYMIEREVKILCRGNVKIFEHLLCCR